jgi:hypothetical protein
MLAGFAETAAAIAIILSVTIRMIRADALWKQVEDGAATAETLSELTGIADRDMLIELFGPPRLEDGVFLATRRDVRQARTGLGLLMGDWRLDGACCLVAIAALIPVWPPFETSRWLGLCLLLASGVQAAGWIVSLRPPGSR